MRKGFAVILLILTLALIVLRVNSRSLAHSIRLNFAALKLFAANHFLTPWFLLSIWDVLFGTFKAVDNHTIDTGL